MNAPRSGGASISARARTPSINLARLAELLATSIAPKAGDPTATGFPLAAVSGNGKRLRVNLRGVLQRLFAQPSFTKDFAAGDTTGFIRDLEFPPRGTSAKMGGKLLPETEAKTTAAIGKLQEAISAELDKALSGIDIHALTSATSSQALAALAKNLSVRPIDAPPSATLVPIGFASPDRKASEREKDVARVLTAIETIEGREWLDKMLSGIRRKFQKDDVPDEEIDGIIETLELQRQQPGSQIRRFLDFLDDEALARLRLQVTFRLMAAIASHSEQPGLVAYVERVQKCFDLFGGTSGEALPLDVSIIYGQRNCSDLADHLRKAMFYGTLPVWPEWSVQLFEARVEPEKGFATKREVSYRFRVNGNNPETGKSAFASRLDRIQEQLLSAPGQEVSGQRAIAELVFLRLVVPDSATSPTAEDLQEKANAIAAALKTSPVRTIERLLESLRNRESVMEKMAAELISVLKNKSTNLVNAANRTADKFYVAVKRGIVDWNAALSLSPSSTEVLVKNDNGHDNIVWFNQIEITDDPASVPTSLASYWVETNMVERSLAPTGDPTSVRMARDLEQPVIPVRFVSYKYDKKAAPEQIWVPEDVSVATFDAGMGIDLEYEVRPLSTSTKQKDDKETQEQLRTASCAAFALVSYLILWEMVRRLKAAGGLDNLAMFIFRLQPGSKEVDSTDGNAAVYAAAQAIERALMRELPVKMQGFHTQGKSDTERFRRSGSLQALQGGAPMLTDIGGSLDKMALMSYVTRPSDAHPLYPDADGFLFVSRTYRADREGDQFKVYAECMQSRLVDTRNSFLEPQLVREEIARLRAAGYHHVVLLSHHFGNRHIGRAAERHSPHGTFEFLEDASKRFSDVYLYPLRRDVFPATRLHKRQPTESGFEVLSFDDHQAMYDAQTENLLRGLMPIYTFATLAVVGEAGRPQSGFCTYFFGSEQRLSSNEWSETVRQNALGTGAGKLVRESLVGLLRTLHYLESEKSAVKQQVLPVLDPFDWASPVKTGTAGELQVMKHRRKGAVQLSFPALLGHVTKVLHKEAL
jgi:hypothetical protein